MEIYLFDYTNLNEEITYAGHIVSLGDSTYSKYELPGIYYSLKI